MSQSRQESMAQTVVSLLFVVVVVKSGTDHFWKFSTGCVGVELSWQVEQAHFVVIATGQ